MRGRAAVSGGRWASPADAGRSTARRTGSQRQESRCGRAWNAVDPAAESEGHAGQNRGRGCRPRADGRATPRRSPRGERRTRKGPGPGHPGRQKEIENVRRIEERRLGISDEGRSAGERDSRAETFPREGPSRIGLPGIQLRHQVAHLRVGRRGRGSSIPTEETASRMGRQGHFPDEDGPVEDHRQRGEQKGRALDEGPIEIAAHEGRDARS